MSLLENEAGLIALLLGAVLLGVVVVVAASLSRPHDPPAPHGPEARSIVAQVAATAPTDAHMTLGVVAKALRRLLRRRV